MFLIEHLQAQPGLAMGAALVFGMLVGSFLNVVVYRLPVMMERDWREQCRELAAADAGDEVPQSKAERFNLVVPRSRCPSCGHGIRAHENVPVISYLFQRGRCSSCGWRIPLRYPALELLTGILSLIVIAAFGATAAGAAGLAFTYALVALAFIDLDTQYLPDDITLPLLWAGLALNFNGLFVALPTAVAGAMAGYLSLWVIYWVFKLITGKEGMGHGDFKLMAAIGAWLGWSVLPGVILLSSVVGAVVGITLILVRGHDRQIPIPFGPYIAAAGWLTLIWGDAIKNVYLGALSGY